MPAQSSYKVTVEGHYYRKDKKGTSPYRFEFNMPEESRKLGFLAVIRRDLLQPALEHQYPDAARFRTHFLVKTMRVNPDGTVEPIYELDTMSLEQLQTYLRNQIIENPELWPIDIDLYPTIDKLRQAVRDLRDNRDGFIKQQDKIRERHGTRLETAATAKNMNAELLGIGSVEKLKPLPVDKDAKIKAIEDEEKMNDLMGILG